MKKIKTVLSARREKVRIHDPLAALIARMCDPNDPIYDENVAKSQVEGDDNSEAGTCP